MSSASRWQLGTGRAALGTLHGKAPLVAPPLESLGFEVVLADLDTNRFGTFTGEVPRPGSAQQVVELKARAAARAADLPVGLASEGSFGPHPDTPLVTVDLELVCLVDVTTDLVVVGRASSLRTAAAAMTAGSVDELEGFCGRVGFGAQALVVRPATGASAPIFKGVHERDELRRAIATVVEATGAPARVETDLRADRCPTRRPVIAAAAEDLAARLTSRCPDCGRPGFGPVDAERGRACGLCGLPTRGVARLISGCACGFRRAGPDAGPADPATCDSCNP
ncbi:MAG: DUF6671 family protein [Actinomycetota bacterium]|jgi:hypothetical protein